MRRVTLGVCAFVALAACAGGKLAREAHEASGSAAAPASLVAPAAEMCAAKSLEPTRYLRQLSLDLRGHPPSFDELDAVAREGKVSDARIDAMLHSDDFLGQVRAWHKPLLWPNVDKFGIGARPLAAVESVKGRSYGSFSPDPELLGAAAARHPHAVVAAYFAYSNYWYGGSLSCDDAVEYPPPAEHGTQPTYSLVARDKQRHTYAYYDTSGVPLPYHDAAHCPNLCSSKSDAERSAPGYVPLTEEFTDMTEAGADPTPDDLDPPGKHCPAAYPHRVVNPCDGALHLDPTRVLFVRRHGYRPMVHYWSRGKALKTCAREAQTREIGLRGEPCASTPLDPSCGCGPGGVYCMPSPSIYPEHAVARAEHDVHEALDAEPLQIVESVVSRDEDYFDVFTTRRSFVTGPLAYFFRHQSEAAVPFEVAPPAPPDAIPDLPYDDEHWHEYARGEEHSGVLTTPAYLIRFPTWRSRVSQFRTEMMCRPFTPSVDAFPGPGDACTREPNLAKRCGCRNCHASIEPMAAWFGRWGERSAKYLDPSTYPAFDPQCEAHPDRDPIRCKNYVTGALDADGARYAGTLLGYLYRSPEEQKRIDEGPRGLVREAIESGELEACTVTTAWKQLVGRPMTDTETTTRLPAIERDFEAHHRSYRELVRAIATSPEAQMQSPRAEDAGREPKRLDADRLRASLFAVTGFNWVARHTVSDPDSPNGRKDLPDADMIEVLAATLGRANYSTTTSDAIDPAITFAKLAGDAARAACRASVNADVAEKSADKRRILRFASSSDTLASNGDAVRHNLTYLALRFWGRQLASNDPEIGALSTLFDHASKATTPTDGWRAVCIALATDPSFLTY